MAKLAMVCCNEQKIIEYWHEHNDCGDERCYAQECEACYAYETLCGMKNEEVD